MSARTGTGVRKTAITVASAAAIAMVLPAVKKSEGYWPTVKVDRVGTGQPCTGGYGETEGVKCGETHTEAYWSARLEKRMREYDARIGECIHVEAPDSVRATMITTSYNAGTAAVCRSPMVAKINARDFRGACAALLTKDKDGRYNGWYITTKNHGVRKVVPGLINRRRDDQKMCFAGVDKKPTGQDAVVKAAADALPAKVKADFRKAAEPVKVSEGVGEPGKRPDIMPVQPSDPYDPYACFGSSRYAAMGAGRTCPPAKPAWHKWIFK